MVAHPLPCSISALVKKNPLSQYIHVYLSCKWFEEGLTKPLNFLFVRWHLGQSGLWVESFKACRSSSYLVISFTGCVAISLKHGFWGEIWGITLNRYISLNSSHQEKWYIMINNGHRIQRLVVELLHINPLSSFINQIINTRIRHLHYHGKGSD